MIYNTFIIADNYLKINIKNGKNNKLYRLFFPIIYYIILSEVDIVKRKSGVLLHISSLWGEYSEGAFGKSAREWIDFLADCGFSLWQTLPFCLPDDCNSPYKSYSAFSLNPYFIDLEQLSDEGLITKEELETAKQETPYSCEFERLSHERMELLTKAAQRFSQWDKVDEFLKEFPQTENFCSFMGLKASNSHKCWIEWETNTPNQQVYKTWKFTQYKFYEQWMKIKKYANDKGISIIGDIPIYVAYDSSDVWANPEQFQLDKRKLPTNVAGVPPDYFCEDGQLWGNPLYDWDKMKADGYLWWQERMKFMTQLFDGVRIDHFRGLESYYSIPADEKTARNGKWVKGPGMDFIDAIKKICNDKLIIAEDLGDITPEVHQLVKDSGFPGMRVLQFGFLGDNNSTHLPHNYENNCVAYTGTHDNNTLLGYVWELDDNGRRRLFDYCGFESDDIHSCYNSLLRTMFASSAGIFILPLQDLLLYGSDTRINTPGRSDGNWSFRITKEQLNVIDKEKFRKWNSLYAR